MTLAAVHYLLLASMTVSGLVGLCARLLDLRRLSAAIRGRCADRQSQCCLGSRGSRSTVLVRSDRSSDGQRRCAGTSTCCWTARQGGFFPPIRPEWSCWRGTAKTQGGGISGVADAAYVGVVRRLVAFAPQWRGPQGNAKRVEFFLPLFGHENSTIHELAYLELARAPYGTIKRLARAVPRASIEPILRNPMYIQWRPLAILLLAQSPETTDKQYILEIVSRGGTDRSDAKPGRLGGGCDRGARRRRRVVHPGSLFVRSGSTTRRIGRDRQGDVVARHRRSH